MLREFGEKFFKKIYEMSSGLGLLLLKLLSAEWRSFRLKRMLYSGSSGYGVDSIINLISVSFLCKRKLSS